MSSGCKTLSCLAEPLVEGARSLAEGLDECPGRLVAEAVVVWLRGAGPLVSPRVVVELGEEMGSGGLEACLRAVRGLAEEAMLEPCGRGLCIELRGGRAGGLADRVRETATGLPRVLGVWKGLLRIAVEPGGDDILVEAGDCSEDLNYLVSELLKGRGPWALFRRLILWLKGLGLTPGQLDKLYKIDARVIESPFFEYRRLLCTILQLDWRMIKKGRADLPRPAARRAHERMAERVKREVDVMVEVIKSHYRRMSKREPYWENGFTVEAVDPLPSLRSLCLDDVLETLRRLGLEPERIHSSTGFGRESHHVIVLSGDRAVEVNCSAYLDENNWVRVYAPSREEEWRLIREILRDHYKRVRDEAERPEHRWAYEAMLRALEEARSIEDLVRAAARVRKALDRG